MNDRDLFPPDDSNNKSALRQWIEDNKSALHKWIKDNNSLARILTVWLLFIFEMAVAKFFGDFDLYYNNDIPAQRIYVFLIISSGLALLSFINVYFVPIFANWFHSDKPKPATRLVIGGAVFSSFFCAPLIGIGLGAAFALFLFLTLVHMYYRYPSRRGLNRLK